MRLFVQSWREGPSGEEITSDLETEHKEPKVIAIILKDYGFVFQEDLWLTTPMFVKELGEGVSLTADVEGSTDELHHLLRLLSDKLTSNKTESLKGTKP